jgi:glutamate dehydrogenase/leucine dehydrogenase
MVPVETKTVKGPGTTPEPDWDGGMAARTIVGEIRPVSVLLSIIAERIRVAADHLRIAREDLFAIFEPHTVFEGETDPAPTGPPQGFLVVETHHLLEGMVGKGALKIVFPHDLLEAGPLFKKAGEGAVEVLPPSGVGKWEGTEDPERVVKQTMRELMTGESLSMSLKCQATGAPFAGSEGLVLCARRVCQPETGRYFLQPALCASDPHAIHDRELIEFMMNSTAEKLTRANRIGYDKIVHAAETNSTLTAQLKLHLPTNVVEGHLRALLQDDPAIVIGDDDMTARLREVLADADYAPTGCALAKAAAVMQMDHAILLPGSRQRLRELLASLPAHGSPTPAQYRAVINLFFGAGETQQQENTLFHHREPILRTLSVALSVQCLDECGDPEVLSLYLRTLLDNQRVMLQAILMRRLPPGESLPVDWFKRAAPLTPAEERELAALVSPSPLDREQVARRFLSAVDILFEAMAKVPDNPADPYRGARRDLLQLAIRAVTSAGDVIPSVERIVFFTLPFTYDCATPRLGVVTRKPIEVCGSELRPQAMAVGALFSIEILLQKFSRKADPFPGLTVAIEGLGNAGKNLAGILAERGAKIVGVSDSRGALIAPDGLTAVELRSVLAHKDAGKRLDTYAQAVPAPGSISTPRFCSDPAVLKKIEADLLVLTAIPGSIDEDVAGILRARCVCELTGAAVTGAAKQILKQRHIEVIPDNLASSGGMLVSLSEMLQNSAAQFWDRRLEEKQLREQISKSYDEVIKLAGDYDVDIPTATDMLALRRMQQLAVYRKELKKQAMALVHRIRLVGGNQRVLIVADDDEDGAASAAILSGLFARLNPAAKDRLSFLSESFRSEAILGFLNQQAEASHPIRHIFVLDRSYPLTPLGERVLTRAAAQCRVTFINNHDLPAEHLQTVGPAPGHGELALSRPAELGVLLISPQMLRATVPARHFPTAMILKELAHTIFPDDQDLAQVNWQAAVGSVLDVPELGASPWLLFYAQFNPDKILEAAYALRTVTRAGGFLSAINALSGVTRPDQLETNEAWGRFMAAFQRLEERVQVLVEKVVLENRRKPVTAHFFTPDELASPVASGGIAPSELVLYHWISERLTGCGDLAEKPIIVGQTIRGPDHTAFLAVRIRSPRGVDLMKSGLPSRFESGGLPNTAVAQMPLPIAETPKQLFDRLVEEIWRQTTHCPVAASPEPR